MLCSCRVSKNTESRKVNCVVCLLKLTGKDLPQLTMKNKISTVGLIKKHTFLCKELVYEKLVPKDGHLLRSSWFKVKGWLVLGWRKHSP